MDKEKLKAIKGLSDKVSYKLILFMIAGELKKIREVLEK